MNINDEDNAPTFEWSTLGSELLEGSMRGPSYEESVRLLHTPGVDPALYMLFCALPQGYKCVADKIPTGIWSITDIKSLMECAFMLGTYVKKSIEEVEKLW